MKLTFLGTGTSMGVPVAGGFMREELFHDARNERTRCSVWSACRTRHRDTRSERSEPWPGRTW